MSVNTFTADQLYVSEHNVRTDADAIAATGPLEESIAAVGLFFPLIVHPGEDGRFGVLDGGRRYRAISRLIKAGRLAPDWPIECVVREGLPADITEQSLGAFLLARDLHPYETNAAVARAAEQGHTPEEIARNLGQSLRWVNQQLRLGRLAPEIFAAYAEGRLSTDLAQAYAATEDQDLQRRAFEQFSAGPAYSHRASLVRQFFKVGDHELARLLNFVGADIYRSAGGRFELDLFADEASERGRVTDEDKLRELAENKLGLLKHDLRRRTGRSDLRFAAEPQHSGRTDYTLEIKPGTRGDKLRLPAGDLVCSIDIGGDGEPLVRWWWASRKAKAAAEKAAAKPAPEPSDPGGNWRPEAPAAGPRREIHEGSALESHNVMAAQAARAAVREDHGLSSEGLHVVRSLRRELLRALLVQDVELSGGNLANDYLIWAQLRMKLTADRASDVGAQGLSGAMELIEEREPAQVKPFLAASEAHEIWSRACAQIAAEPFITDPDRPAAFSAFVASSEETKALAAAVLAGIALLRSANADGWRVPAHDRLAALAHGDDDALSDLWSPEPEFLALFTKAQRLAIAEPLFGPSVIASWSKLKDEDLARTAATALAGNPLSKRPLRWIHPLLSFGVPAFADAPMPEAAE